MCFESFDDGFLQEVAASLGRDVAMRFFYCIKMVRETAKITKELETFESEFTKAIARAKKSIKSAYKDSSDSLSKLPDADVILLNETISEIKRLTSKANYHVNNINVERLCIPDTVWEDFTKYDELLPPLETSGVCLFRHDLLRKISQIREDPSQAKLFSLIAKYRKDLRKLRIVAAAYRFGINEFNQWIHDMGHYLTLIGRMRPRICGRDVQMLDEDLHTLDALFSGIRLLEMGLQMSLRGEDCFVGLSDHKQHPYEPYKVFHKLRYIYSEKGIIWRNGDTEFWGKVAPAKGIEFVAMNLYTNAVKYIENYPGPKEIATIFTQKDTGLEICIESYGPMPNEEEEQKISREPRFRASVAREYKGSGRGLCRVRRICEDAGYEFSINVLREKIRYAKFAPFVARIFIPKKYQINEQ